MNEYFLLRWDEQIQRLVGNCIYEMQANLASNVVQQVLGATVLTSLASAVFWPALLVIFFFISFYI